MPDLVKTRFLVALAMLAMASACRRGEERVLTVFAAASLGPLLSTLTRTFEATHAGVDVRVELSASRLTCTKVSEQGREADVVLSADHELIDELLVPKHAAFNLRFASNAVVLAYTEASRGAAEIARGEPWQQVLLREDVAVGIANPEIAPVGARALAALRRNDELAPEPLRVGAQIVAKIGREHQRPDVAKLIAPLQAGELDFAFVYLSEAQQHALPFVSLDPRIDASRGEDAAVYGLTVPRAAPEPDLALTFVRALLGPDGQTAARAHALRFLAEAERWSSGQVPAL